MLNSMRRNRRMHYKNSDFINTFWATHLSTHDVLIKLLGFNKELPKVS